MRGEFICYYVVVSRIHLARRQLNPINRALLYVFNDFDDLSECKPVLKCLASY